MMDWKYVLSIFFPSKPLERCIRNFFIMKGKIHVLKQPITVKISFIRWYIFDSSIDHVLLLSPVLNVKHKSECYTFSGTPLEMLWPVQCLWLHQIPPKYNTHNNLQWQKLEWHGVYMYINKT